MKKITLDIDIKMPRAHVWRTLWSNATYPIWTSVFNPEGSSTAKSDWKEGSKIYFLGDSSDGMVSRIAHLVEHEFMSFEHLGEIKDGIELASPNWAGALENYRLTEVDGLTRLQVELDSDDAFENFFSSTFPKALELLKNLAEQPRISPFLWFDTTAREAFEVYANALPDSAITSFNDMGNGISTVGARLCGQAFTGISAGPMFKLNAAASLYVTCESEAEIDQLWATLSDGGSVMMPLGKYPWSQKYGWVADRYGLSWQLSWADMYEVGQKIVPSLLFVGSQHGRCEEAINLYTSIFKNSGIEAILRYGPGENDPEGTVKHAQIYLDGQVLMLMESAHEGHDFGFNEAFSFVVNCDTQDEVDYYWNALTADGGTESMCGWLKDKFGVSWQIIPRILPQLLSDAQNGAAATQAMMKMRKIIIADLIA